MHYYRRRKMGVTSQQKTKKTLMKGQCQHQSQTFIHKSPCFVSWNKKNIVHYKLLEHKRTSNVNVYCQKLVCANEQLLQKLLTLVNQKIVISQPDTARLHAANKFKKNKILKWEVLSHPSYSTDLASLDFYLFRSL